MRPFSLPRVALAAALVFPAAAYAQDRSGLLLPVPTAPNAIGGSTGRAQPGVSTASPLGFGPNWGDVFVGIGYQATTRFGGAQDGSLSFGAGFGNSQDLVGLEAVLTSLSTVRSGFFTRTVASLKLHRDLPDDFAVGVGVEGIRIDGSNLETKQSTYVAVSKVAALMSGDYFTSATLNIGVGNGRFQSQSDFIANDNNWNVFGSAAVRLAPAFGAIADWTGQDLNLGLSVAPFPTFNLVITPAVADLTHSAGNGARFTLGAGMSWHF